MDQGAPKIKNIPNIESKANFNNKIKPATPVINNNNNYNNNRTPQINNKITNIDNKIQNNKKQFFKDIAERDLINKKEILEEKKEPQKKPTNFNNLNAIPAKNKEQNLYINNNFKKPIHNEQPEQGGVFVIPNFCDKKPKKKKETEKKEIDLPPKNNLKVKFNL